MKECYSNKEVKEMLKDIIALAFDPNPDADFYIEVFDKYDSDMQEYISSMLLAAILASKLAKFATNDEAE